jgi:hypothetical protein
MMRIVQTALLDISKDLTMHDFRIVNEKRKRKLFLNGYSFELKMSRDEI